MIMTVLTKALKICALPAKALIRGAVKVFIALGGFPHTHRRASDALIKLSHTRQRLVFIARDSRCLSLVVEIYAYVRFIEFLELKIKKFGQILEKRLGISYPTELPSLPQQKESLDTAMMLCIKDICEEDDFEPNAEITSYKDHVLIRKQLAAIATDQFSVLLQQSVTFAFNVTQLAFRWV